MTNQVEYSSENSGPGGVTIDLLCYLRGTRILTPSGEMPIETLHIGDQVITRFGGVRPIKWIGRQSFGGGVAGFDGDHLPVRIRAGALGPNQPARDLLVSPGHSMLIDNTLVLAKTLVNGITITQERAAGTIDYFMLDFGTHDCVLAEGAWSESFADGPGRSVHGLRGDFHNVAEFFALYPEDAPPEELVLCAPRPLRGRALEKVLAPIIARAASGIEIGPLDGCVDTILGRWDIEGWAFDSANPDLPVELEVFLEGRSIGTVLACDFRADLRDAGKGKGSCAFRFRSPVSLRPDVLHTLTIRRASDRAKLHITPSCLQTIEAAQGQKRSPPRLSLVA